MSDNWSKFNKQSLQQFAEENDIPASDIRRAYSTDKKIGRYVAIDCEFVGVGIKESALARVSLVNYYGHVIYDQYVKPKEAVTDWRTVVSGIQPHHMKEAEEFGAVQQRVHLIIKDRILIGHSIKHDLKALLLSHPKSRIRDTSKYPAFRAICKGTPGLAKLAKLILGKEIQSGEHSSVEDARACMELYRLEKEGFEKQASKFRGN